MNSRSGCSPGWVVIRVWVIGGTAAPAAYAVAAACCTPAAWVAQADSVAGTGAAGGRAGLPAASRYTPAATVTIHSSMAAISTKAPFVPTLPARGITLTAMSFAQATSADGDMMELALAQARASLEAGGVPVGAALAQDGQLIAAGHNERVQLGDPVAHGEISALRNAGRRATYAGTTMYTTLSPCPMCTGAILLFQIPRVVVGEAETFAGDLTFLSDQGVEVVLLNDERCKAAMREFQRRYPDVWSEDIGGR
jgi:cytosine/creatinine deaminase